MVDEVYFSQQALYSRVTHFVFELRTSSETKESFGSAVLINNSQLITNYHNLYYTEMSIDVLYNKVEIRSAYEEQYITVTISKIDKNNDLALLQIPKTMNSSLKFSKSKPKVGDTCYLIGNANNFGISMNKGMISLEKVIIKFNENSKEFIQVDGTSTIGMSGGALVNDKGKLIGIITLRIKNSANEILYGYLYAIPIEIIIDFLR